MVTQFGLIINSWLDLTEIKLVLIFFQLTQKVIMFEWLD